ncbi:MAG: hypothetical protein IKN64_04825 [Desulfovibrio sp.]|nr:hypothetical protein [Desulfovibrio sp.]
MTQSQVFPPVLLLSDSHLPNAVDKKVIREAGCQQITSMGLGEEAARFLADDPLGAASRITVVNERLTDMSGEQFCTLVRMHPRLTGIPLLLVLASENERDQLQVLGCGASDLLARPFSVEVMQRKLQNLSSAILPAQKLAQTKSLIDSSAFDACLDDLQSLLRPNRHRPEEFFKAGMQCLAQKKWNSAISAFHRAMSSQLIKGEAELGMACAYKGKGKEREMTLWLQKACDSFVACGKWQLARMVFARLAARGETRNPFFVQARKQILDGHYEDAVTTLMESLATVSESVAGAKMAELCTLAQTPSLMLDYLSSAIGQRMGDDSPLAGCLFRNFSLKQKEQSEREEKASEERALNLSRRLLKTETPVEPEPKTSQRPVKNQGKVGIPTREEERIPELFSLPDDTVKLGSNPKLPDFSAPTPLRFPGLGDLLTMIKMTWHLVRKQHHSF